MLLILEIVRNIREARPETVAKKRQQIFLLRNKYEKQVRFLIYAFFLYWRP